jgi:hypothetical protein
MAWTMIGPPPLSATPTSRRVAVTCGSDEHGQAVVQVGDAERVAEGMAQVIVADAMLAGARRNIWRMPPSYLAARMATSYLAVHCAPSRSWPRAARPQRRVGDEGRDAERCGLRTDRKPGVAR